MKNVQWSISRQGRTMGYRQRMHGGAHVQCKKSVICVLYEGFCFQQFRLRSGHRMAVFDFDDAHIIMAASVIIHSAGPAGVGITVTYGHSGYLAHAIMHAYHHAARQG
jgi:hypothetical protein